MFKSLDELKAALSQSPQAAEIIEYVNDLQIKSAEQIEQIGSLLGKSRRANSEAVTLKALKKKLTEFGYEGEDPEEFAEWFEKQKATAAPAPDTNLPNPEIEKLRREFKKAQEALAEKTAEASKVKMVSDSRAIKAKLTEALRDKIFGHDLLAETLIAQGKVKLAEDETVVFVNGEDEIDFDKGIKKVIESRPDLQKNTQAGGAKSSNRQTAARPVYTLDQIRSMSSDEMDAHMEEVTASMKALKT